MLCDPIRGFEFDFSQDTPTTAEENFRLTPHRDGIAHGIAFWFNLHLGPGVTLSTSPLAPSRIHTAGAHGDQTERTCATVCVTRSEQDHADIGKLNKDYSAKAGAISSVKRCICSLTISCGLRPTLKYRMTSSIPAA